jgi:hypothetical protein
LVLTRHYLNDASRDSSVGIAKGYALDGRGLVPSRGYRFLFLSTSERPGRLWGQPILVYNGHLWGFLRGVGVNRSVREADHSSLSNDEVRNGGPTPPFRPIHLHGVEL